MTQEEKKSKVLENWKHGDGQAVADVYRRRFKETLTPQAIRDWKRNGSSRYEDKILEAAVIWQATRRQIEIKAARVRG